MKISPVIPLICLAALLLVMGPAGAAEEKDYTKVFIIPFTISDGAITPGDATLQYGYSPNPALGDGPFRGILADTNGRPLMTFPLWDPRVRVGDTLSMKPDGTVSATSGRFEKLKQAKLTVIIPFSKNSGTFTLNETHNSRTSTVNLQPVIRKFCETHAEDPDCGSVMPPLPVLAGILLILILAAGGCWFLLRKQEKSKQ
jgi:hypothetical protein